MPKTTKRVRFSPSAPETIDEGAVLCKMFERLQKHSSRRKGILVKLRQRFSHDSTEKKVTGGKD